MRLSGDAGCVLAPGLPQGPWLQTVLHVAAALSGARSLARGSPLASQKVLSCSLKGQLNEAQTPKKVDICAKLQGKVLMLRTLKLTQHRTLQFNKNFYLHLLVFHLTKHPSFLSSCLNLWPLNTVNGHAWSTYLDRLTKQFSYLKLVKYYTFCLHVIFRSSAIFNEKCT